MHKIKNSQTYYQIIDFIVLNGVRAQTYSAYYYYYLLNTIVLW